jgi:long-chain acyl-CoA synthetase
MSTSESVAASPLSALAERARSAPDEIVLVAGDTRWTAGGLLRETDRLAAALASRGVRPGDRIAIHLYNIAETAFAYLACFRLGAIAAPLNIRFKTEELIHWVERLTPSIYLGQAELYESFADVPQHLLPDARRFSLGATPYAARSWSELIEEPEPDTIPNLPSGPRDPEAPAVLLATSGTTSGRGKLVVWTHKTLAALAKAAPARGYVKGCVRAVATPMMHASGVIALASTCLTPGCRLVLLPRFEPDLVLDAFDKYRCTSFSGLPFIYAALAERQAEEPRDVSSLQLCTVVGDTCPAEIANSFQRQFGLPLLGLWGSTEEPGATIPASRPGPFSRLLAGVEARVVNEAGKDVAAGETGELWLKSGSTTPGYWEGPGMVAALPGGIFRTGDIVRMTAEDEFEYIGRRKDIIVRGGSNISPVEVEEVLRTCPFVVEAAVAGIADPVLGQRVGALLVLAGGVCEDVLPAILGAARQRLADYKMPELLLLATTLPRAASTKIDRRAVADLLAQEASRLAVRPSNGRYDPGAEICRLETIPRGLK